MSYGADEVREHLERERVLAILRPSSTDGLLDTVAGLADAGLHAVELSLVTEAARAQLAACVERFGDDLRVGAGTVRTVADAEFAMASGAQFLVAPAFNAEVHAWARAAHVLYIPGVFSPGEVDLALQAGLTLLKLFPAARLGPDYVRDLLGPFPMARFLATGGISDANAAQFMQAGAVAVAVGGALVPAGGRLDRRAITQTARTVRSRVLSDDHNRS